MEKQLKKIQRLKLTRETVQKMSAASFQNLVAVPISPQTDAHLWCCSP